MEEPTLDTTPLTRRLDMPEQIFERMAKAIREGVYPPGTPLPTAPDLAALFGVGESTARSVYRLLTDAGLAELVVRNKGRRVPPDLDMAGQED
jgi:GntR family transcriptional regulator, sialic acid-inducible nan operon repressor